SAADLGLFTEAADRARGCRRRGDSRFYRTQRALPHHCCRRSLRTADSRDSRAGGAKDRAVRLTMGIRISEPGNVRWALAWSYRGGNVAQVERCRPHAGDHSARRIRLRPHRGALRHRHWVSRAWTPARTQTLAARVAQRFAKVDCSPGRSGALAARKMKATAK